MDNAKVKEKQLIEKARADARQILIDAKEEVNDINFNVNGFALIDVSNNQIYPYASIQSVEKISNTSIKVNVIVIGFILFKSLEVFLALLALLLFIL